MRFLKLLLSLIFLFVIQSVFISYISIQGIAPDALLIFLVYWAYHYGRLNGILIGFLTGLIQDLIGAGTVGVFALSKSIACYIAGSLTQNRYELNPLFLSIVLFIATFLHHLVCVFVDYLHTSTGFFTSIFRYAVPSSFYTAIVGLGLYYSVNWIQHRSRRK